MSNSLSIAAVTLALRRLLDVAVPRLDPGLLGIQITTRTPDQARTNVTGESLNLFLYRAAVNAAWANLDPPRVVRPGESGLPSLALDLNYLLTAYSAEAGDATAASHRALGAAMGALHDHPVLDGDELRAALAGSDVHEQLERIRVTPLPLTVDDISKLWGGFATQYRLSVAYQVSVVLIDSSRPTASPLPVLTRGPGDSGITAVAAAGPSLRALTPPNRQQAVRLGEELVVDGAQLTGPGTVFRFTSLLPDGPAPVELTGRPPAPGEPADLVAVRVPALADDADALGRWAPGFLSVAAAVSRPDIPVLISNEVTAAIAPAITVAPDVAAGPAAVGSTLTVTCAPRIRPGQRVLLLLGGRQVAPTSMVNPTPGDPAFQATPTTLTFEVPDVPAGTHTVRLRVDGIDSIPALYAGDPPVPSFDPGQQVLVP